MWNGTQVASRCRTPNLADPRRCSVAVELPSRTRRGAKQCARVRAVTKRPPEACARLNHLTTGVGSRWSPKRVTEGSFARSDWRKLPWGFILFGTRRVRLHEARRNAVSASMRLDGRRDPIHVSPASRHRGIAASRHRDVGADPRHLFRAKATQSRRRPLRGDAVENTH
jgi:hypothetical protein